MTGPGQISATEGRRLPGTPGALALSLAAAAWLAVFGYAVIQARLTDAYGSPVPAFAVLFRTNIGLVAAWVIATPLILWSAVRYPLVGERWGRHLVLHSATATVFIGVSNVINCAAHVVVLLGGRTLTALAACTAHSLVAFFHYAMLSYFLIVALGQLAVWARERQVHRVRAAELQTQLGDARLRALQLQLQPHFLYNTLNTVSGLVLTNRNAEAVEVLTGLGDLLRQMLSANGDAEVTVEEEIRLAKEFLAIECVRFSDRLRVSCVVDPAVAAALIPRFILQPIVENAVRHGIAPVARGGSIDVGAERVGESVRILVSDDGAGLRQGGVPDRAGRGTGLAYARGRLAQHYGAAGTLTLMPRAGGGTNVLLECPYHTTPPGAARTTSS